MLLLLLPLLFTLAKDEDDDASGDRSHQYEAEPVPLYVFLIRELLSVNNAKVTFSASGSTSSL